MTILDALLYGVGVVGNTLDTPGALVRNTLSGRDPFAGLNPFNAEGRASGRDMLESWGRLDPNQEGLDWGDVAGFGAELLTDPLNFIGFGVAKNAARAATQARAANASNDLARQVVQRAADFHNAGAALPSGMAESVMRQTRGINNLADAERLLLASPEDAARQFAELSGWDITGAPQYASDIYRHASATPFGVIPKTSSTSLGTVPLARRDIAFFAPESRLPYKYQEYPQQIAAHELLHNMVGMHPEARGRMGVSLGRDAIDAGWDQYASRSGYRNLPKWLRDEEGMANIIQNASLEETARGYPLNRILSIADSAGRNIDPVGLELSTNALRDAIATVADDAPFPEIAARDYASFLVGRPAEGLGPRTLYGDDLARSVSPVSYAELPADPMSFIPENSPVPSVSPILAALLGHNTLARGSQF